MNSVESATRATGKSSRAIGSAGGAYGITLVLITAAAVAIRFRCLTCKPFWFDECFSVEVSRVRVRDFVHLLWWREANMSLYYLLLRGWMHLGQSPFFIRSLSVAIAAATVPAVYWLADLLYDRRVAIIAAVLCAFNAYSVRYAQEARSYALFLLMATLSSALLIRYLRDSTDRNRIWYVSISVLAVYAHFYALLLLAAQWLALRWKSAPGLKDDFGLKRAWILIAISVSPLLIFVAKTGAGPIKWIQRPGVLDLLEFFEHLAGSNSWELPVVMVLAAVVSVAPFARRLLARNQPWEVWRAQFLLVWLLFPILLTVLLSFARPVFLGRYMIFCLPPLLILAAAGVSRLRRVWMIAPALAIILIFAWQGTRYVYGHDFDNERDASGAAANLILNRSEAGDAIIFHIAETRIPYEFYRSLRAGVNTASPNFSGQLGPEIVFPTRGPGLDYRDFTGKPTSEVVRSAAQHHLRMWVMLLNNNAGGKPDPTTSMLTQILSDAYPKVTQWTFAKLEVRLYSRKQQ